MKILIVLTSHDRLGDTDIPTGFWYEELAGPYYLFTEAGHDVTLASPRGGKAPVDPKSARPPYATDASNRFEADEQAQKALANTVRLDDLAVDDFDAVFYPGGHGPLYDLAGDAASIALIENYAAAGKIVGSVCHGPAVFINTKGPDGRSLVEGRRVSGFTNGEEEAMGLTDVVPFLVEDELIRLGANYQKVADFEPFVVTDGLLVTGQNPASATGVAKAMLELSRSS
ncbi:type 1 glutamine amidotransferase domain-containing protein [Mycolicibacterium sp. 120270]|uniref:type 1 glutamine amidotransferase domain-containing protein n=1 Tax=Mycolicibacterium sp. 120270 TaxID=3090600 RepID=UPI00299EEFAE|nr:type 1 glutamine amidotransferase domain-containing protein [Mycolicibacterium sp. 120270]MDX1887249.1 type 1 glutamine amidotransferase domain-containing protein [Mycolicibacterium sp. 120270]